MDAVTKFLKAQAKVNGQIRRLTSKPVGKWKQKHHDLVRAAQQERDAAAMALSPEDFLVHVRGFKRPAARSQVAKGNAAVLEAVALMLAVGLTDESEADHV